MKDMFKNVVYNIQQGNINIDDNTKINMSATALIFLKEKHTNADMLEQIKDILNISNMLYNNTDIDILPLEDGVYDLVLEKYKNYNPNYQVGAEPIDIKNLDNSIKSNNDKPNLFVKLDKINKDEMFYYDDLIKGLTHKENKPNTLFKYINSDNISRRTICTPHVYPKLVGTLDKCKYVLDKQAKDKGVYNDSNVKILERDFFAKHIQMGIINPDIPFKVCLELKYDGVSVEAEVATNIKSARTRGDVNEGIATDLTPILKNYPFHKTFKKFNPYEVFGMKFEAIMTYDNLIEYNIRKGKSYKNCRTAISGLFSSSDANDYVDLITLVPLATSIEGIEREVEIKFMNYYYTTGIPLIYSIIEGNYYEIMFKIKKFVEEAELLRSTIPFMYDGIVVSYVDNDIKEKLGRVNSVNKYSVAVKFNPLKKLTIFRGYSYSIGQDGLITPIIHYDPVEFYGTIHDKSSGHSYERFKALNLRLGDIIEVEYVNDVMPYVSKPSNSHNDNNINPPCEFITVCPSCNKRLTITNSKKSVLCSNIYCPERNIKRVTNMVQKLNLKDFSEAYLLQIAKYSLTDLLNLKLEDIQFLGQTISKKFIERMNELKTKRMYDYVIVGALGFNNIGQEKWKLILKNYTIQEICTMKPDVLKENLVNIKGIGITTVDVICEELDFFRKDLETIMNMQNIVPSKGTSNGKIIRFTGFRDKELMDMLNNLGHNASDGSITKKTDILLVPHEGFTSSKTNKASENTMIVPVDEFKSNIEKYLN